MSNVLLCITVTSLLLSLKRREKNNKPQGHKKDLLFIREKGEEKRKKKKGFTPDKRTSSMECPPQYLETENPSGNSRL